MIVPLITHNKLGGMHSERMFKRNPQLCNHNGYDLFLETMFWFHRKRYLKMKLFWQMDKAEFFMKGRML